MDSELGTVHQANCLFSYIRGSEGLLGVHSVTIYPVQELPSLLSDADL